MLNFQVFFETIVEFIAVLLGSYLSLLIVIVPVGLIICGLLKLVMIKFESTPKPSFDDQLLAIVRDFTRRL